MKSLNSYLNSDKVWGKVTSNNHQNHGMIPENELMVLGNSAPEPEQQLEL